MATLVSSPQRRDGGCTVLARNDDGRALQLGSGGGDVRGRIARRWRALLGEGKTGGLRDPVVEGRAAATAGGATRAITAPAARTGAGRGAVGGHVGRGSWGGHLVGGRRAAAERRNGGRRPLEAHGPRRVARLLVEAAGIADGRALWRPPPKGRSGGAAVAVRT